MARYDQSSAECFVFTFKEGLLSPVAHDLRITIQRFTVDTSDDAVVATFDTSSLRVDTAMKDGRENPGALSEADKNKIAAQIREDVLHSSRYPEARFASTSLRNRPDGGYDIAGELSLHGVTRPLSVSTRSENGRHIAELTLHQPDFNITPYKAMMGTLKIQADVRIRLVV